MTPPPPLRPALAIALSGLAIAVWQKIWGQGIQIELIALGVLLAPLALGLWDNARSGGKRPPTTSAIALLAFGGAHNSTFSRWFLLAGVLALLPFLFAKEKSDSRPSGPLAWAGPGSLGIAAALLWASNSPSLGAKIYLVVCLVALCEALSPWRVRTWAAGFRRLALGVVACAFALLLLFRELQLHLFLLLVPAFLTGLATLRALLLGNLDRRAARRRLIRFGAPLFMLGACLTLICVTGEIYLRATGHPITKVPLPNPSSSWHEPGKLHHYEGPPFQGPAPKTTIRWNNWGFADANRSKTKQEGHTRILVVGDSYIDGVQVSIAAHYHTLLEGHLNQDLTRRTEVVAYGWSGWGQANALEALEKGGKDFPPGLDLAPDLVVLEFLPSNDVRNNHPELERICNEEAASPLWRSSNDAILSNFYFGAFLLRKLDLLARSAGGRGEHLDNSVYEEVPSRLPKLWGEAWNNTEALIKKIRDLCRSRGAVLVVVNFSGSHEAGTGTPPPGMDFGLPAARMKAICEKLGVSFYDTTPDIRSALEQGRVTLEHDGHWNERGHAAAAKGTAEFILGHPELRALLERKE